MPSAVGAGVSYLQNLTLNPTSPTGGEEGCGRPVLHCGVGSGAACGETKDVSKNREINKIDGNLRFHHRVSSDGKTELFL